MEQDCHYLDLDDKDLDAFHIYGTKHNEVVAYARLLAKGVSYPQVSIGRVLVVEEERGKNVGHILMEKVMQFSVEKYGDNDIKISAQEHLTRFYELHGFKVVTEMYYEDDIPHVGMLFKAVNS